MKFLASPAAQIIAAMCVLGVLLGVSLKIYREQRVTSTVFPSGQVVTATPATPTPIPPELSSGNINNQGVNYPPAPEDDTSKWPAILQLPERDMKDITDEQDYLGYKTAEASFVTAYARSGGVVYYVRDPIVNADYSSFRLLRNNLTGTYDPAPLLVYAKDNQHIYYRGQKLDGVNVASFMPVQNGGYIHSYGSDGTHVFFHEHLMQGADPLSFKILWVVAKEGCSGGQYSKDSMHVYFEDKIVLGADVASFEAIAWTDGSYGKDKRGYYEKENYVGLTIDPKKLTCSYG